MSIDITSTIRIDEDGKAFIDFENKNVDKEDPNSWYQRFEIVQDDKIVYSSEIVKPGGSLETIDLNNTEIKGGEASVVIYRCKQTGKQIGSNTTVELNVVDLREQTEQAED